MKNSIKYFFISLLVASGLNTVASEYVTFINHKGIENYKDPESRIYKINENTSSEINFINMEIGEAKIYEENKRIFIMPKKDKVLELVFRDVLMPVSVPTSMDENTCDYSMKNINCKISSNIATKIIRLKWIKHPDTEKTGTLWVSERVNESALFESAMGFDLFQSEKDGFYYKELFQKVGPVSLSCDNPKFLSSLDQNGYVNISEWSFEQMFENSESETSENRTDESAFGVKLKKRNNEYVIEDIEYKILGNRFFNFFAENWGWYESSKQCNISLKPDILSAFASLLELNDELVTGTNASQFKSMDAQEVRKYFSFKPENSGIPEFEKGLKDLPQDQLLLIKILDRFFMFENNSVEYDFGDENTMKYINNAMKEF